MIVRYHKQLDCVPEIAQPAGCLVREYASRADQAAWIGIHQRAFGHEKPWTRSRFEREFREKEWWQPRRMLFAIDSATNAAIGTITLGEKQSGGIAVGTVAWLAVEPSHQRCGLGALLLQHLEFTAIAIGYDRLELETLAVWGAANRLYEANGWNKVANGKE